ncbi:unnamed protein product [Microthlaspi erraticum]|uniref:BHLH domain-containing protein n=1 Tax=Microthlaspi erraticum TaxID=1685480 RepID=A0A6D2HUY2_9BRAS|nr:unnamed protein product [Microthlaspi erraticum]
MVTLSFPSPSLSCVESGSYKSSHVSRVLISGPDENHAESSEPNILRDVHISERLMEDFTELARENTEKDLETCGTLAAFLERGIFYVTTLIIPKQESTANTCQAMNEVDVFSIQNERELYPVGWIHTHPSQGCFMSSVDLHTHFSYQVMVPEAFAIVVAPTDSSMSYGIFKLTDPGGMEVLRGCSETGFHTHKEPEDGNPVYEQCSNVFRNSNLREMMRGGERVKEFLRPFVASRAWDFCVIWKLGDDPSRFIEWVGCCCSGSYIEKNIKLENVEEATERKKMSSVCRDEHNKHHIKTLACEALSHFPLSMPLYPGIHGEVVMSKSPRWLVNSCPGSKKDIFSTRVLVPVRDGLIELFSFIMKPVDEGMVDLIISRCNAFCEPFPEQTLLQLRISPTAEESMSSGLNLSFECGGGSSSVSNPSSENQTLFGNPNARFGEQGGPCLVMNKEEEDAVMQDTIELKANKRLPKENFKSKNLLSERKRRDRINQRLYALRSVVPRITKMNKNGTLSDAVDYIKELQVEKQKLEDELNGINEMECREIAAKVESVVASPEAEKVSAKLNNKVNNEVTLEVHEIGERDFLIKVAQEHTRDGFKRLIEAADSCGLEIVNVNFTRLNLTAMTLLNVKANKDVLSSRNLRDLLLEKMATSESVKHST